ncbi:MAG TPA: DUF4114 domain-containing protein, partial [Rhodospirillales bacterium]|nr:DUF4114 domain-containing protein [Rhodospirillales bacterium]
GAEVVLSDPAFDPRVARYVVDGEDLVVTLDNGAVLRLEGFFAAEDNPPSLSVLGGPEQTATALLAGAAEAAAVEPAAGPAANAPAHGGGAGFAPFDAGDIGEGLTPSGVLPPTELAGGLSLGDLLEGVNPGTGGVGEEGGPLPGEAPEITVQNYVRATAAERSVAFDPASTDRQLRNPDSTDPVVRNGVDPDNLTLDQPREVEVVFQSEEAGFDNTLGVFTIGDDGSFGDVGIVFPNVSQIGDSDGDGTLTPGTRTSLGTFDAGTRLGFFIIPNGANVNPGLEGLLGSGHFELRNGNTGDPLKITDTAADNPILVHVADDGTETVLSGGLLFSTDATPGTPEENALNPDGAGKTASGFKAKEGDLLIGFEDLTGPGADNDLNDVVFRVHFKPVYEKFFFVKDHDTPDFKVQISDTDSTQLSGAEVTFQGGQQAGDRLALATFEDADGDGLIDGTNIAVTENPDGSLTFSGKDSVLNYEQVLNDVRLVTDGDASAGNRFIGFEVTDAEGHGSDVAISKVNVLDNLIVGTEGRDVLTSGNKIHALSGRGGNDLLTGKGTADYLDGGDGRDQLFGMGGDDLLHGGPGIDTLWGGDGADTFRVTSLGDGRDIVRDFDRGEGDRIDLSELLDGSGY